MTGSAIAQADGATPLAQCMVFAALSAEDRRALAGRAHHQRFVSGETIFIIGDPGLSMMAIIEGIVRVSFPAADGREIVLADLAPGEVLGEVALLDGRPRSASAVAYSDCDLLVLDRRDVLGLLEQRPAACLRLLSLLCERLRRSDERMADIAFRDLPARLAKTLLAITSAAGAPARTRLSQGELARMVGSARENVNRHLRDWHRRGIIEISQRGIAIQRRDALSRLAGIG